LRGEDRPETHQAEAWGWRQLDRDTGLEQAFTRSGRVSVATRFETQP
jgi:hypothetical protein